MLEVRYATVADFQNFRKLRKKFFYAGESNCPYANKGDNEYNIWIDNENIILLTENSEIIGYALMQGYDDGGCVIKEIYVDFEKQKQGIGKKFVNMIKSIATDEGFRKIELISANMDTDRFWSRCGFKSVNYSDLYQCELN